MLPFLKVHSILCCYYVLYFKKISIMFNIVISFGLLLNIHSQRQHSHLCGSGLDLLLVTWGFVSPS